MTGRITLAIVGGFMALALLSGGAFTSVQQTILKLGEAE